MSKELYRSLSFVLELVQTGALVAILVALLRRPKRRQAPRGPSDHSWNATTRTTTYGPPGGQSDPSDEPTIPVVRRAADPPPPAKS